MTTEIAVLNRLGVALATDSAVTITRGSRSKVFDTADKLFELSALYPVGLMINGNMDCLGVPWETLVKDFRESEGHRHRPTVEVWCTDFVKFADAHPLLKDGAEDRYVSAIVDKEVTEIVNEIGLTALKTMLTPRRRKFPDLEDEVKGAIAERTRKLDGVPQATSLGSFDEKDVTDKFGDLISERSKDKLSPPRLAGVLAGPFASLVARRVLSSKLGPHATGIVVAGYGETQDFPAMAAIEADGKVFDRMKYVAMPSKAIDHVKETGKIQYFAQTDVIERLLGGVDPRFVKETGEFIEKAFATSLDRTLPQRKSRQAASARKRQIAAVANTVKGLYLEETAPKLSEELNADFERMIAMMPKHDLLEFAEALVSITAVERKATSDIGTVGGPIDVAMITKHEGFVWVKRKHYFSAELNPRYFWRKYRNTPRSMEAEGGEEAAAGK